MLIPKKNRKEVYEYLFHQGVLVAKKDFNLPKHPALNVPNLEVIRACQSLKSRGFVTEQFNWQYYYYYLTTDGIEYLRGFLHLPADVVPATLKKKALPQQPRSFGGNQEGKPRYQGGKDGYRQAFEKNVGAGESFNPEFKGGFGRGKTAAESH